MRVLQNLKGIVRSIFRSQGNHHDQVEKDLQRKIFELQVLQDVTHTIVHSTDVNQIIQFVMNVLTKLFDYDACALIFERDDRIYMRLKINPSVALVHIHSIRSHLIKGMNQILSKNLESSDLITDVEYDLRHYNRNQTMKERLESFLSVPLVGQDGFFGFLDISSLKKDAFSKDDEVLLHSVAMQIALSLQRIQKLLAAEMNEIKTEFISMVSHEMRTPLSVIKTSLENLSDLSLSKPQQEKILHLCIKSLDRISHLVNNHLDLSKIEKGVLSYQIKSQKIHELVLHAIESFQTQIDAKHLRINNQVTEAVPEVWVDQNRFVQIVTNLVHNAIKFTPEGGEISLFYEVAPKYLEVSVKDTGIGIAKEDQDVIFEKYTQLHDAKQLSSPDGAGLGLAIVKNLVDGHHGTIWVESQVNKGCCFTFTLPLVNPKERAA